MLFTWMLKSPVMMKSCGVAAADSRKVWNWSMNVAKALVCLDSAGGLYILNTVRVRWPSLMVMASDSKELNDEHGVRTWLRLSFTRKARPPPRLCLGL